MLKRTRSYLAGPGLGPTLVRATLGSAGLRVLGMGFSFLVGVQLARGLGVEGYGIYGLAMSIIALLNVPTQFGVPQLLTREVAAAHARDDWPRIRAVLTWASRTVSIATLVVLLLLGLLVLAWPQADTGGLMATLAWGLALVPLIALANVRGAALRGLQRIVLGQMPEVLLRPAAYSLMLAVAFLVAPSLGPASAMALHAAAAGVTFTIAAHWLRKMTPKSGTAEVSVAVRKQWLASAIPMALNQGIWVLQGHIAVLLLGVFANTTAVGLYRVSYATMIMAATPIALLIAIAGPVVAKLHAQGDRTRLQRMAPLVAAAMVSGAGLLSAPFVLAGSWILEAVFGAEFQEALPALLVLCSGQIISAAFGANAPILNMTGHERRVTRAFAVSLLINTAVALVLLPLWDEVGAAMASSLALIFWNLLMWNDARTLVGVDTSIFGLRKPSAGS